MPDPRFFENRGPLSLDELARLTGARLVDSSLGLRPMTCAAVLDRAGADDVTYLSDRRHQDRLRTSQAGACFITQEQIGLVPDGCVGLITPLPQAAWSVAALAMHPPRRLDSAAPAIHPTATLEAGVEVGHGAVIGEGAQIGAGTTIGAGAVIGPGVAIGRDCSIGATSVIHFSLIGDRVRILAGAKIGEAGFGVTVGPKGLMDIPQLGRVILQDGVTVGAGSCIDRGAYNDTTVGENTKIDNLVQIGHNVTLGRNCVLAGQVGIAGSVTVEDGVQFGGRCGVADHLHIGAGARVAAASVVAKNVPAGQDWAGYPARLASIWRRELAWLSRASGARARQRGGAG